MRINFNNAEITVTTHPYKPNVNHITIRENGYIREYYERADVPFFRSYIEGELRKDFDYVSRTHSCYYTANLLGYFITVEGYKVTCLNRQTGERITYRKAPVLSEEFYDKLVYHLLGNQIGEMIGLIRREVR